MSDSLGVLRTVPFGAPTSASTEEHNPGRYMYSARQSTSYSGNGAVKDPYKFFVLTGKNFGEDPHYVTNSSDDQEWASGPPGGSATTEHAMEKAGYWTHKGGPNSEDNSNDFGFENFSQKGDSKFLYNMGHGTAGSSAEGMEYGAVGVAGFWMPQKDSATSAVNGGVSQGIVKCYMMYRMDASEEYLEEVEDALQGIIDGSGFTFSPTKDGHRQVAQLIGESIGSKALVNKLLARNELTSDLLTEAMGTASTILKIIKNANKLWQGIGEKKQVEWLAECTSEGTGNTVPKNKAYHVDMIGNQYYYFCYHLNPDYRQVIQLMRCRFNGWLWHTSSHKADGVLGVTRIMRFKDVVPLYAHSYTKFGATHFRKVLRKYDPDSDEEHGIHVDKYLTLDDRG